MIIYFFIQAVIAQIFICTVALALHTEIPTKEAKVKIKTHPVTVEAKQVFNIIQSSTTLLCFLLINSLCFIPSKR